MLVLKRNRHFVLCPSYQHIDIESQLPIPPPMPKTPSVATIPFEAWNLISLYELENIYEYIKQFFVTIKNNGYKYSINNRLWHDLAKYIYSVSSNSNKRSLKQWHDKKA